MRYFEKLDIGFDNILTVDVDYLLKHHSRAPWTWDLGNDMIDPAFLSALRDLDIGVRNINLKCSGLGLNRWPIHCDECLPGDQGKINWVLNDDQSAFVWYGIKAHTVPRLDAEGHYVESDLEVVCEQVIGTSTLVQTGVPHSVRNVNSHPRFNVQVCLCRPGCLRPTFGQVREWIDPLCKRQADLVTTGEKHAES